MIALEKVANATVAYNFSFATEKPKVAISKVHTKVVNYNINYGTIFCNSTYKSNQSQ